MTTMAVMPRATDNWTVDDLAQLPDDDGLRYELIDGTLIVSPAPIPLHQRAVRRLTRVLEESCPPNLEVFFAPLDWQPDERNSLEPDLLVVANEDVGDTRITSPLKLAVEVLSASSRLRDTTLKYAKYAEGGVASYWIVDPATPSIVAYDLHDGRYVEVANGTGDDKVTLERPFPVTVTPHDLVTR
ncbi:Uma2 family endonuclease [Phytoactinopolyspora endophytica]|uniref:Uma2 family endonuclease n=1 Tax=Phytoactinopolyspora endophytica TaxID=1642495 RepID=UPI00101C83F7|nr:Uma2 family endonuclease [Phytoactinopolyspora endophytica]